MSYTGVRTVEIHENTYIINVNKKTYLKML